MREPDWAHCTEEQLWKYVATHLDLVQISYLNQNLPLFMKEIGFKVSEGRHYSHPRCKHLIVEFVSGPPGIGEDTHICPAEVKVEGTTIKLYSPTDCIRDRLASYIHFNAMECLEQAVPVAQRHPFDRAKVKKWCIGEGAPAAFTEFEEKLKLRLKN